MRSLFKLINEDSNNCKKPKRILKVSSLKKLRAYGWWVYARLMYVVYGDSHDIQFPSN